MAKAVPWPGDTFRSLWCLDRDLRGHHGHRGWRSWTRAVGRGAAQGGRAGWGNPWRWHRCGISCWWLSGLVPGAGGGSEVPTCPDEKQRQYWALCRLPDQWPQCAVEVLFLASLLQDKYLFQPHLCDFCHQFVPHVTAKILVAAIQNSWRDIFCYPGNKAHPRGGETCYVGGRT